MHRTSDFDYPLPPDRIAQEPLPDRAGSRLLVLERATGAIRHRLFRDIGDLMAAEDVLVLNTSRVIPARLHGKRETGNVAELLLVRELPDRTWLAMGHPGGKLKPGRTVRFGSDSAVEIIEMLGGGLRRVKFLGSLDARATLEKYGEVPLPPYIRRPAGPADRERYQTVYAEHEGSVAAPTAGLHFTPELLDALRAKGVAVVALDLHIGPGTFKPVEVDDLAAHVMHPEPYLIPGDGRDRQSRKGGRAGHVGGGDDGGAGAGDRRRRARPHPPRRRGDRAIHLSSVPISGRGPAAHELPSSPLDAADARVRVRGERACDARLSGSGRAGVPVLFLRRRDGRAVATPRNPAGDPRDAAHGTILNRVAGTVRCRRSR